MTIPNQLEFLDNLEGLAKFKNSTCRGDSELGSTVRQGSKGHKTSVGRDGWAVEGSLTVHIFRSISNNSAEETNQNT